MNTWKLKLNGIEVVFTSNGQDPYTGVKGAYEKFCQIEGSCTLLETASTGGSFGTEHATELYLTPKNNLVLKVLPGHLESGWLEIPEMEFDPAEYPHLQL